MSVQPFPLHEPLLVDGVWYRVERVFATSIQLANSNTGELRDVRLSTLIDGYVKRRVQVGMTPDSDPGLPAISRRPHADIGLEHLSDLARHQTIRRITWVVKLRDRGAFDRDGEFVQACRAVAQEMDEAVAPHRATILRWRRRYLESGGDLKALVVRTDRRGGAGRGRFGPEVEEFVAQAIDELYLGRMRCTAGEVHRWIARRIDLANQGRLPGEALATPGLRAVQRRLSTLGAREVFEARHGPLAADRRFGGQATSRRTSGILEIVEADQTPLDCWVVGEDGRSRVRPNLTLVIDRFSRAILGFFLSTASRGVDTVFGALRHALLPKSYLLDRYPDIEADWPMFGWPDRLLVDNGAEFAGKSLEDAATNLGIHVEFARAYQPNDKPHVERAFRTINYGLVHSLPGTSLDRVASRQGRDLEAQACLTLGQLEELLHHFIVDKYHQRPHRGLGGRTPRQVWCASAEVRPPRLRASVDLVDMELSEVASRTLGKGGIEIQANRYNSPRLGQLRSELPGREDPTVLVKFRRADVARIFVWDEIHREYIAVDNIDADKAGLSAAQDRWLRESSATSHEEVALSVARAEERIARKAAEWQEGTRAERASARRLVGADSNAHRQLKPPKASRAGMQLPAAAKPAFERNLLDVEQDELDLWEVAQ